MFLKGYSQQSVSLINVLFNNLPGHPNCGVGSCFRALNWKTLASVLLSFDQPPPPSPAGFCLFIISQHYYHHYIIFNLPLNIQGITTVKQNKKKDNIHHPNGMKQ